MKDFLAPQILSSALSSGFMKPVDLELIPLAKRTFGAGVKLPAAKSAFFYPSAGADLVTPLIIALLCCSQFYFYDHDLTKPRLRSIHSEVFNYICHIKGLTTHQIAWIKDTNSKTLNFEYFGKRKTLRWVGDDNRKFLSKTDLNLVFYFHRGDSYGEGGSRQFWDSVLLPDLRNMISYGGSCYFITDGEPGGPTSDLRNNTASIKINASNEKYYLGQIKHPYYVLNPSSELGRP